MADRRNAKDRKSDRTENKLIKYLHYTGLICVGYIIKSYRVAQTIVVDAGKFAGDMWEFFKAEIVPVTVALVSAGVLIFQIIKFVVERKDK